MIHTVLGDISAADAGTVLSHEHIQCLSADMCLAFGDGWARRAEVEQLAVQVLTALRQQYGVGLVADATATDMGRDVPLLQRISRRSGVYIAAASGLFCISGMLTGNRSAAELADILLRECTGGLQGTGAKPGFLKAAAEPAAPGSSAMNPDTAKRLAAVARVQAVTGLPLYVHCGQRDDFTATVMDALEAGGADPRRTVIGHASRRPEAPHLESILRRGYYIGLDQCRPGKEHALAAAVAGLCAEGWAGRMLASYDHTLFSDFFTGATTGLERPAADHAATVGFVFDTLLPAFAAAGVSGAQCRAMVTQNPCSWLDV